MHGKVDIILGGEHRKLCFNNYAKVDLISYYDKELDIISAMEKLAAELSTNYARALSKIAYSGLVGFFSAKDEDMPYSRADVAEWMGNITDVESTLIINCWRDSDFIRDIMPKNNIEATQIVDTKKKKR